MKKENIQAHHRAIVHTTRRSLHDHTTRKIIVQSPGWPVHAGILFVTCAILFCGLFQQFARPDSDAAKYQCYAVAFWQGTQALKTLPDAQCAFLTHSTQQGPAPLSQAALLQELERLDLPGTVTAFVATQSSTRPYHALPHEYPLLAIPLFSLGLLGPTDWYQPIFALWMALIAITIYILLLRSCSSRAAYLFLAFLLIGNWATALGRFDLALALLTLLALLCAQQQHWNRAFLLLALATLLKFYPAVLLLPFLIAQNMQNTQRWYAWQRFVPVGLFLACCAGCIALSLGLNVVGTLEPFSYFGDRPLQMESSSASLLWLISTLSHTPLRYAYAFGSRSVFGAFSPAIASCATLLSIVGLAFTCWLQWRRKITLSMAVLLLLLIILVTGKVFSAQYLLWVTPIIAAIDGWHWRWLIGWGGICLLTTLIYPFLYYRDSFFFGSLLPDFSMTVLVRNALLLGFTCLLLYRCTRRHPEVV